MNLLRHINFQTVRESVHEVAQAIYVFAVLVLDSDHQVVEESVTQLKLAPDLLQ